MQLQKLQLLFPAAGDWKTSLFRRTQLAVATQSDQKAYADSPVKVLAIELITSQPSRLRGCTFHMKPLNDCVWPQTAISLSTCDADSNCQAMQDLAVEPQTRRWML